uniref:Zinc finger, CCHC-type n=1 Tax=Tanacetum cinerariifolium TaxID=118510 RepID=A0A6L2JVR0_TANCI|nr:zinc finger, CCHC-type [Tanacetum cinerariifolium]
MKDIGEADVIFCIRIKHESNGIAISQSYYIEKVLKKFNYSNCTLVSTPLNTCEQLMPYKGMAVSQLEYFRVIGCLMYAMTCTRPDIAFDVGKLNRYTSNPGTQHWQAIQKVLKYLKKTMNYRLVYFGYPLVLEGYTDARWISNTEDNSFIIGWPLRAKAHVLQSILRMCLEPAGKEDEVANFSMVIFFEKVLSRSMNKEEPPMEDCWKFSSIIRICSYRYLGMKDIQELLRKLLEDLQIINEELEEYINSPSWNRPAFYDDDDYEYSIQVSEFLKKSPIAVAPVLPTKEPDNSLSMGDEHLSTISKTKSDKVIKFSVEDLVPILSESEGILDNMSDVPFSDKNHFDAESDLIEYLLTQDTLIFNSFKIDSLLEEFTGELVQIDPIPPGIDETNFDPKDDIRFIKQLLYDDTSSVDDSFEDIDYVEA